MADVLDRLSGFRLGQKVDEVHGMAGAKRDADLAQNGRFLLLVCQRLEGLAGQRPTGISGLLAFLLLFLAPKGPLYGWE